MTDYFQQRIDDTRQAYLDALSRLKLGNPTHEDLVGKPIKINATTIALEAGKSRNPLYHTHKDILEMIHSSISEEKEGDKQIKEVSQVKVLEEKIKGLEEQNKKLMSVNATLLFDSNLKN